MKNYTITVNGNVYDVVVEEGSRTASAPAIAAPVYASQPRTAAPVQAAPIQAAPAQTAPQSAPAPAPKASSQGSIKVNSPMPGKILAVKASVGQAVKLGDVLLILEAMKMENEIVAPQDGTVASLNADVNSTVEAGDVLATLN